MFSADLSSISLFAAVIYQYNDMKLDPSSLMTPSSGGVWHSNRGHFQQRIRISGRTGGGEHYSFACNNRLSRHVALYRVVVGSKK